MANKVTTSKVWLIDEKGHKYEKVVEIQYSLREERFYCRVPAYLDPSQMRVPAGADQKQYMQRTSGQICGESPSAVLHKLQIAVDQYERSLVVHRKVLLYKLGYQKDGCKAVRLFSGLGRLTGSVIQVDWCVRFEHQSGDELTYTETSKNVHGDQRSSEEWEVVEWTQQRQEFFESFQMELDHLMLRVEGFLGDKKKLLSLMDSGKGRLLLSGPKEE
jgi:hypothetical protein